MGLNVDFQKEGEPSTHFLNGQVKRGLEVLSPDVNDKNKEIPIGTQCRNPACTKTYDKNFDPNETCWYHSGTAIFHEGMKYWSCCQRKTSDFESFLQQEGCTSGRHCFRIDKNEVKNQNNCRYDWHQTGDDLYVTIYGKLSQPADSWFECDQVNLKAHVEYDDGDSIFNLDVPLWGAINVDNSQVTMTAAKVEICMKKSEKVSWPKLIFVEQTPVEKLNNN
uniref:Cysteine and histidine-rich domain-containing protein 1 n=1 Tax=Romanomermis culicivorax TaxID=13658 RepID=A0A915K1W4_ROMCU